jgi:hypothetical protein
VTRGELLDLILRKDRGGFESLLRAFLEDSGLWEDMEVRRLYEFDLLNRPFVYRQPLPRFNHRFEFIDLVAIERDAYVVQFKDAINVGRVIGDAASSDVDGPVVGAKVDHARGQIHYMAHGNPQKNAAYCHGKLEQLRTILPIWKAAARR